MSAALVLLRHGRTAHNADGRLQGQLDLPLDATGRDQAGALAPVIAELAPALVISSDLIRARETAALCTSGFETDPRLREIDLGRWQGLTLAEARERFPEEYQAWAVGTDVARGGGESYAELAERAMPAVEEALERVTDAVAPLLLVTHGGTARVIAARLIGLGPSQTSGLAGLSNCCWSWLERSRSGWRLVQHGVDPTRQAAPSGHR